MARKEKLEALLAADPHDPFLHYALAKEYLSTGEQTEGLTRLRQVVNDFPEYHAAHFQLAQTLSELGETDEAAERLRTGIDAARKQNDPHAVAEMTGFLQMLTGE